MCIFAFMYVSLLYSVHMDVANLFTSFPFLAVYYAVVDTSTCPEHVFSCSSFAVSSGDILFTSNHGSCSGFEVLQLVPTFAEL